MFVFNGTSFPTVLGLFTPLQPTPLRTQLFLKNLILRDITHVRLLSKICKLQLKNRYWHGASFSDITKVTIHSLLIHSSIHIIQTVKHRAT